MMDLETQIPRKLIERPVKIRKVNKVEHLILSSTLDFSTDFVCYELQQRSKNYLRLNRDKFSQYNIQYDICAGEMIVQMDGAEYLVNQENIRSIFFRSPVFIRTNKACPVEKQLYRSQWSSFIRNLTVFERAKWLNHPMYTYQAENKVYQLDVAKSLGLNIPDTVITNDSTHLLDDSIYVVKALDTPLFYENGKEMFTYSTVVTGRDIKISSLREAPVIIQKCLLDKIDLRVTIVGNRLFPVEIKSKGKGINGDWRKTRKEDLEYNPCVLPSKIEDKLLKLMDELHLSFGGIDLAFSSGKYYFIEVNPTGEWGWLVRTTGYEIHKAIVDWMTK